MARPLRIQYPDARYHVINRGNFQHEVFGTVGAIAAFLKALGQACVRFRWRVHAYIVMRNHYHLALHTPEPNLSDGMHWLQTAFAVRLTRYHSQHGHVFQGRYKALLVEDDAHLARVCDYVHLNPVRAGVLPVEKLAEFRWSSLPRWLSGDAPHWLDSSPIVNCREILGADEPWPRYLEYLRALVGRDDERLTIGAFSRGWAIGTAGWRKALAREHRHRALEPALSATEIYDIKAERWRAELESALRVHGKRAADIAGDIKGAAWKVAIARRLRDAVAAPYPWIAAALQMGAAASVRVYVSQQAH